MVFVYSEKLISPGSDRLGARREKGRFFFVLCQCWAKALTRHAAVYVFQPPLLAPDWRSDPGPSSKYVDSGRLAVFVHHDGNVVLIMNREFFEFYLSHPFLSDDLRGLNVGFTANWAEQ